MSYIAKNGRLYTSGASEALTLLDDKFSVNKSYSKGDSCIYNDYLWKFTSDKPAGEWDSSVVEQCRIMDFVDDINNDLTNILLIEEKIPINIEDKTNTFKSFQVSAFKTGYTPIGIVGWTCNRYQLYLSQLRIDGENLRGIVTSSDGNALGSVKVSTSILYLKNI